MPQASNNKTIPISLVLGSGGARGFAHIGIIHWLEEHGYSIQSISGSSIGAVVGGVYAAGKLDEFEQWVTAITKLDMVALMDISFDGTGLLKGDKIINSLVSLVGEVNIEDLPIRYTAVATDIEQEKEVWLNSGRLFDAVRASISLPFILTPFKLNGIELVDGAILNPVPIAPTFSDTTELTIAINLSGPPDSTLMPPRPEDKPPKLSEKNSHFFDESVARFIDKFRATSTPVQTLNLYNVANQSFDTMQGTIARLKLAAYPPDITVTIPRNTCSALEFHRASEMIDLGYALAATAIPPN